MLKETVRNTEVVIAALNEERGVGPTIDEMLTYLPADRILVVDGHSRDKTVEAAVNHGAGILYQDGKGKGDAIVKAIENMNPTTNYVVLTDADFTYPAEYIPMMLELLEQNPKVGMVCGNRLSGETDDDALYKQFYYGNRMLAFAHNLLNGIELKDPLTGLRVIRAELLRDWELKSKGFDIEVELNSLVQKQGYLTLEIPIGYRKRVGIKKLKIKDGFSILKRMLMEIFD